MKELVEECIQLLRAWMLAKRAAWYMVMRERRAMTIPKTTLIVTSGGRAACFMDILGEDVARNVGTGVIIEVANVKFQCGSVMVKCRSDISVKIRNVLNSMQSQAVKT